MHLYLSLKNKLNLKYLYLRKYKFLQLPLRSLKLNIFYLKCSLSTFECMLMIWHLKEFVFADIIPFIKMKTEITMQNYNIYNQKQKNKYFTIFEYVFICMFTYVLYVYHPVQRYIHMCLYIPDH